MMEYFVRAKFYGMRSTIYYQIIQYILIIIIFLRPYELGTLWEVLIILFIMMLAVFIGRMDRKLKVLEREQSIANTENKELREIRDLLLEAKNERRNNNNSNIGTIYGSDYHVSDIRG